LSQIKITGYPRNDILFKNNRQEIGFVNELKRTLGVNKFILYAPTFRNNYEDNIKIFDGLNTKELGECLTINNAAFFIKMHPKFYDFTPIISINSDDRVYWLRDKENFELNGLLPEIDLLITDYSGAYFDYLLLNRPIIFTPFDFVQYISKDRELYESYNEATPGIKCYNWNEVIKSIEIILRGEDNFIIERHKAIMKYHTFTDANSSKRVVEMVKEILKYDINK